MSCPKFKEKFNEHKFKDKLKRPEEEKAPEPEPVKEDKRSWWEKLKDRIDPSGIGGLPQPSLSFLFAVSLLATLGGIN